MARDAGKNVVSTITRERMEPPPVLTAAEKKIWTRVIESQHVDWLRQESVEILIDYCRATVASDILSKRMNKLLRGGDLDELRTIAGLRDREARRMITCAMKMRLTHQANYEKSKAFETAKRQPPSGSVWKFGS